MTLGIQNLRNFGIILLVGDAGSSPPTVVIAVAANTR